MDLLVLIAAAAVTVWLAYFTLRGSLVAGCLGFWLAACCFGYPFWQSSGGPMPLTIDRLAIVFLAGVYIVQRAMGRTDPKPLALADKLLLAFLTVLTVSCFTHQWQNLPPGEVPPVWRLDDRLHVSGVLYWVARQSRLGSRQIGLAHGMLACFGLYLAATGLLEAAHQWALRFSTLHRRSHGRLALTAVLAARWCRPSAMGFASASPCWPDLFGGIVGIGSGQLFWFAVVPLQLTALYFSYTRSVWIGTSLAIFVVALADAARRLADADRRRPGDGDRCLPPR